MSAKIITTFVLLVNIFGAQCLAENCTQNADCKIPNSVCLDQKCTCEKLATNVGSKCLLYAIKYKGYCEATQQCEWLGGNCECKNGRCQCVKNYRWYQGKCQRYAKKGEKCSSEIGCYSGFDYLSLKCNNNVCTCNDGYYDRGSDCRLISKYGSDCAIDLDCQDAELICKGTKCVKNDETLPHLEYNHYSKPLEKHNENFNETMSCHFDDECSAIVNSHCDVTSGICICSPDSYRFEDKCLPGIGPCKSDGDCDTSNTMCFKESSCICKPGYYLADGKCYPELGVTDFSLTSVRDCQIKPALLDSNTHTCYCKNYWFSDDSNQNCIKTTAQQFNNCPTGSDSCNALGLYSYCNSSTHTCSCNAYSEFNNKTYFCDRTRDLPTGSCLRDNDCKLNENCKCNNVTCQCECIENFTRENGTCLPDIGGSCEVSSCSHIGNAKCAGGFCQCYTNMSYIDTIKKCVKVVHHLNDECDFTEQCIYLQNSICSVTHRKNETVKRCICDSHYLQINEDCLRKKQFGDPCMTSLDCTLVLDESFECRNSMCQCAMGYQLKNEYCQRSVSVPLVAGQLTIALVAFMSILMSL